MRICSIALALFFCGFLKAQVPDSVYQQLAKSKEDTGRAKLYNTIGRYYQYSKLDSALYYFDALKKLSKKINYQRGLINYAINVSQVYNQLDKPDTAFIINKEGLAVAEQLGDQKQIAFCEANLGNSFSKLGQKDSCILYYLKAQTQLEEIKDSANLLYLYGNIASLFHNFKQYSKALEYAQKAVTLAKMGIGNRQSYVFALTNLSGTLIDLKQYDSTLKYALEAVDICQSDKNYYRLMANNLQNIIATKIFQKKYQEIGNYLTKLESIKDNINSPAYNVRLQYDYARNAYYKGKLPEAEKYALQTLKISISDSLQDYELNSYNLLLKIESGMGNLSMADDYEMKADSINQMNLDKETAKNVQELEKKYETQKKENEILKLQQDNQKKSLLNKIFIGSTLALFLVAFLGYRNFKNKQRIARQTAQIQQQKITELEKDKQLLTIDAMLKGQEEERSRIAKDLHDGLGGMLSGVKLSFVSMKENMIMDADSVISFENSITQLDNTIAELRKVAHNLMPEALVKFGLNKAVADFCNAMQLASKIKIIFEPLGTERQLSNTADLYVYRIIQELINNAIKHAIPNQILVQLTKTSDKILLTVEDDGKGFIKEILASAKGIGIKNLQQRIDYFKGKMELVTQPGEGTSVNIELMA